MASPPIRLLVCVPGSGSSLLMHMLAQNERIGVTSRLILMGNMPDGITNRDFASEPFVPDYSLFSSGRGGALHPVHARAWAAGKDLLVSKEEPGNDRSLGTRDLNVCNFRIVPDDESIRATRPIFGFRDPVRTFDTWKSRGWTDVASFILAYQSVLAQYRHAVDVCPATFPVMHEQFVGDRDSQLRVLRALARHWEFQAFESMLDLRSEFGQTFLHATEREAENYRWRNPRGIFSTVRRLRAIRGDVAGHGLVTMEERGRIQGALGDSCEELREACAQAVGR